MPSSRQYGFYPQGNMIAFNAMSHSLQLFSVPGRLFWHGLTQPRQSAALSPHIEVVFAVIPGFVLAAERAEAGVQRGLALSSMLAISG